MAIFGLFGSTPNVEQLNEKRDVPGLIKALNYQKDAQIRRDAANALGRSEDSQAVASLNAAIKDGDPEVRIAVAQAPGPPREYRGHRRLGRRRAGR